MGEVLWRSVPLCVGYEASTLGEVRNAKTLRILRSRSDKDGYLIFDWADPTGRRRTGKCHRAVASAFIPNPDNKPQVNHRNGIRYDNRLENLEWVDYSENHTHAYRVLGRKTGSERPVQATRGDEVLVFPSVIAAARAGFNRNGVYAAATGEWSHHKGYIWRFM